MSETHSQENGTAHIDSGDSYELKHILHVAAAYLDSGNVDDAEDMLQEALEVEESHPDVLALARRLDHVRSRPSNGAVPAAEYINLQPDVLLHFTHPLPGVETQSPVVQRLIRDAEGHYAADRLMSALDSTYLACVESPRFLAGFVRLAELQLALGKTEQARDVLKTLSYWHETHEQEPDLFLRSLDVALNPSNVDALAEYASDLLEVDATAIFEPFVPQAIFRTMTQQPDIARRLSQRYLERLPGNLDVQRLRLHVLFTAGDLDLVAQEARDIVTLSSPVDLLVMRAIAESKEEADEWLPWVEAVCVAVRADQSTYDQLQSAIIDANEVVSPERQVLLLAAMADAANQWQESVDRMSASGEPLNQSPREAFVRKILLVRALENLDHAVDPELVLDGVKLALHPEVDEFARATNLFGVSVAPTDLLKASTGQGTNAIEALQSLRDANPQRLELRSALAELYLESGQPHEAVRELRYVAQEHENAGKLPEMVQAMRLISSAVPGNVDIKAKLIEGYLRRGVLDEAIVELGRIGDLYLVRDRRTDAVAAFTRGAEIASATGSFEQGNDLFRRAVEANPDDVPVRHAAVAFYLQTGAITQATEQLREVVRIVLLTEDRDEAVAALHQIIALAPEDPDGYHKLGEVLTALGEYTQAERVYRRLASFSPYDPVLEAKQSALAVLAATK